MTRSLSAPALSLALGLAAPLCCGGCSKADDAPASAQAGAPSRFLLAAEPPGAVSVLDAQKAVPKDDAVVVGRVREVTRGLAAFTLVDASLTYCGQVKEEGGTEACENPWDYCCHPSSEVAAKTVSVAAHDGQGGVERVALPELRPLDLVVVRGRVTKSSNGSVEIAATGWWRKERPRLPDGVKFP